MSSNVAKFDRDRLDKGGDTANEGNSRNPIDSAVSVPGIHTLGDADLVRHFGNSEVERETTRSQEKGVTQRERSLCDSTRAFGMCWLQSRVRRVWIREHTLISSYDKNWRVSHDTDPDRNPRRRGNSCRYLNYNSRGCCPTAGQTI